MTLARGTRLGSYEILPPIGAGGMGEVFRSPGWFEIDPNFDPLPENPRFQKLVAGGAVRPSEVAT